MEKKRYIEGLAMGGLAFGIWGLLPLYWKLVRAITPYEIFAQRVVWSFVFVVFILVLRKKTSNFKQIIRKPLEWKRIMAPSFFISVNWLLYIWAVNNNYVIETSLGYYINPLVLTIFGSIFYKEKLDNYKKIGIGLAALGVIFKTLLYGSVPIISLVLAFCFATYGLLKKKSSLDSLEGLGFETMVIGIPSLLYLLTIEGSGQGITGNLSFLFWILISFSGIVTAVPLLLYAESTKRLPLNVVGFLQYLSPTIALFLGIFVFKETFDFRSFLSFSLIWIGLGFFSYSQIKLLKNQNT